MRYFPEDARDIPLAVKYETSAIWAEIKRLFGVDATGAGIAMALLDASLVGKMTSYSRRMQFYNDRDCHPLLSYRKVLRAVDTLDAGGWLIHQKQCPGGYGWQSSMAGTPEFLEQIKGLARPLPLAMPRNNVILRGKEGRSMDLPRTRMISRMEGKVIDINDAMASSDVRTSSGVAIGAGVVRIFNGNMNRGGRLYGLGSSWQNIPATERPRISIDGEPVVELDYSTLHPSLLYAEVGAVPPHDCYAIGDWPRPLVKKALLVLINASTEHQVRLYLAHCAEMAALCPVDHQAALKMASRVIADIKQAHQPIAKFFHKDTGARLMRVDSDLSSAILSKLLRQGIVALPVHDSFLVQIRHIDALENAMLESAASLGLIHCRLELSY